jgi:hypothetical protein
MKKTKTEKLSLTIATVRKLSDNELRMPAGGFSGLRTLCNCNESMACYTKPTYTNGCQ